ncbi:MAG: hypothetical protein SGILL_000323 [Bacillariaceae sp.]
MPVCCPPGSLGAAPLNQLTPKGKIITWHPSTSPDSEGSQRPELSCYQVGSDHPKHVVVVFTDVYGLDQGNHKAFCDVIQERMGDDTTVFCPDLFRGLPLTRNWFGGSSDFINCTLMGGSFTILWGLRTRCSATNIDKDLAEIVEPNVKRTGCEMVGVAGFCFGGWVVGRALEHPFYAAGVGIHPSSKPESFAKGGSSPMEWAERTGNKPILWLPAKEDDDLKPSSPLVQAMAKRRDKTPEQISIPFEDLSHGFVARGEFMGTEYKEGQEKAIDLTVSFFKENL